MPLTFCFLSSRFLLQIVQQKPCIPRPFHVKNCDKVCFTLILSFSVQHVLCLCLSTLSFCLLPTNRGKNKRIMMMKEGKGKFHCFLMCWNLLTFLLPRVALFARFLPFIKCLFTASLSFSHSQNRRKFHAKFNSKA